MVTVSYRKHIAQIGLISVSVNQQGNNIGSKLLKATEIGAFKKNCRILYVNTQKKNISACNFYEKNGYSIADVEYVYHFWL